MYLYRKHFKAKVHTIRIQDMGLYAVLLVCWASSLVFYFDDAFGTVCPMLETWLPIYSFARELNYASEGCQTRYTVPKDKNLPYRAPVLPRLCNS